MEFQLIAGDLLAQDVEAIVNSWNQNVVPWWLLIPKGVSGAIKAKAGAEPFREVGRYGRIPLGGARITSAGKLPFKSIIHVAGINIRWQATEASVSNSVINAMKLVEEHGIKSVAFPLIGAGSGNKGANWSLQVMSQALNSISSKAKVTVVQRK
ncbi:MAG: macro domain-containing protein [Chloroflexota bacterium]